MDLNHTPVFRINHCLLEEIHTKVSQKPALIENCYLIYDMKKQEQKKETFKPKQGNIKMSENIFVDGIQSK